MKTLKFKFLALLVAIGAITGCSMSDDQPSCYQQAYAPTTAVNGPNETTVNVPITLNISFSLGNTCGEFIRFSETVSFPKSVVATAEYTGCDCAIDTSINTEPYVFTAPTAGTYELRFLTSGETPIVKTITVTQ
jgi:hypothetical protein